MTVSTSQGRQFTINKHVMMAMRYAGLLGIKQTPSEEEYQHGRDQMQLVINQLEAEGAPARTTGFLDVTMVGDTFEYTLPASVLDVLDPGMYVDETNSANPDRADGETRINLITQQAYTQLTGKSAKGRPYQMYADRAGDQVVIVFWPIPDTSGAIARLFVHRFFHDTDDGDATLDLKRYWTPFLHAALAQRLAQSASLDQRAQKFGVEAQGFLLKAKMKANERAANYGFVTHRGGW